MAGSNASSVLLSITNAVQTILALALTAASLWFYVEVYNITSLRNKNHYLLDYNVYWPQAIPWMIIVASVLILCVSCCGFAGAKKRSKSLVYIYIIMEVVAVVLLVAAAVISLAFVKSESTSNFVKDTMWDVYTQSQSDQDVALAFGNVEKRLQCCGSGGPRDYKKWRDDFPISCCDTYYHGWIGSYNIDCDFTNKLANERYGCATVALNYTHVVIFVLSAICLLVAFIGVINLIVAVALSRSLKKPQRIVVAPHESESKKVLL